MIEHAPYQEDRVKQMKRARDTIYEMERVMVISKGKPFSIGEHMGGKIETYKVDPQFILMCKGAAFGMARELQVDNRQK